MPDGFGWVPFPSEMDPFQAEIGRDEHFVSGGNLKDGAVISDACGHASPSGNSGPDTGDQ